MSQSEPEAETRNPMLRSREARDAASSSVAASQTVPHVVTGAFDGSLRYWDARLAGVFFKGIYERLKTNVFAPRSSDKMI